MGKTNPGAALFVHRANHSFTTADLTSYCRALEPTSTEIIRINYGMKPLLVFMILN